MNKLALSVFTCWTAASFLVGSAKTADSRPQYKKAFDTRYLRANSSDPIEKQLAAAIASAKCNACHEGANRKVRNRYGNELAKVIEPNTRDQKVIEQAIEEVARAKINPNDPSSPTFGDLIQAGKLPGTD